jgi:predicted transglutaminase-like cysteine proteinase
MDRNTPAQRLPRPSLELVVRWMRKFALKGSNDLSILQAVKTICAGVQPGDYASEILAIYYWVCANIRYMRDPFDTEMVSEPDQILKVRSGDCDDIATLLAAMLMAAGNRCSFRLAAFTSPPTPSHVFVVVHTPAGVIVLDPVANRDTRKMLGRVVWHHDVAVHNGTALERQDAF